MPSGRSNLENLARAKQLHAEAPDQRETEKLLARAEASLRDAHSGALSAESRFTLAYNAAHALGLAALRNAGYRPASAAGHRRIVFQTLEMTAGAPAKLWIALDQYHDRRNRMEYEGMPVSTVEASDILKLTEELQRLVKKAIKA